MIFKNKPTLKTNHNDCSNILCLINVMLNNEMQLLHYVKQLFNFCFKYVLTIYKCKYKNLSVLSWDNRKKGK